MMVDLLFWKKADLSVQLSAMILPLVLSAIFKSEAILAFAYLIVGGVQILSCLIHRFFYALEKRGKGRIQYEITLLVIFALFLTFYANVYGFSTENHYKTHSTDYSEILLLFGFCMLVVSPFLAAWYFSICYREYKNESLMAETGKEPVQTPTNEDVNEDISS